MFWICLTHAPFSRDKTFAICIVFDLKSEEFDKFVLKEDLYSLLTENSNKMPKLCKYCCLVDRDHTSYLSREPREFSCKFLLAGVNFYRFNAKNWHFLQILRKKIAFFYRFNAKNWRFLV